MLALSADDGKRHAWWKVSIKHDRYLLQRYVEARIYIANCRWYGNACQNIRTCTGRPRPTCNILVEVNNGADFAAVRRRRCHCNEMKIWPRWTVNSHRQTPHTDRHLTQTDNSHRQTTHTDRHLTQTTHPYRHLTQTTNPDRHLTQTPQTEKHLTQTPQTDRHLTQTDNSHKQITHTDKELTQTDNRRLRLQHWRLTRDAGTSDGVWKNKGRMYCYIHVIHRHSVVDWLTASWPAGSASYYLKQRASSLHTIHPHKVELWRNFSTASFCYWAVSLLEGVGHFIPCFRCASVRWYCQSYQSTEYNWPPLNCMSNNWNIGLFKCETNEYFLFCLQ